MGLKAYVARRIILAIVLLLCAMSVNFLIFVLMPGDPIQAYVARIAGEGGTLNPTYLRTLKQIFGLDRPLHERYILYLQNMLTWNFGRSRETGEPIATEISRRLGNTLILLGTSATLSIMIGTFLGLYLASKRGTKIDAAGIVAILSLSSLPVFWIGWVFLLTFGYTLRWFPTGGTSVPMSLIGIQPPNLLTAIWWRLSCLVLPVMTLVTLTADNWTMLSRACTLEVLSEDFVVTARAKGLREAKVLVKHVLRPASLPLITSAALTFAGLFGGAIITESIFAYDGMGTWIFRAINQTDHHVLYVFFYISSLLIILANFLVDFVYGLVDPRIKVAG
jgi:peptide/nickel transport system permease protein